ncbi:MAG: cysteine desulfurase [Cyclobacteriaceae bacterium]
MDTRDDSKKGLDSSSYPTLDQGQIAQFVMGNLGNSQAYSGPAEQNERLPSEATLDAPHANLDFDAQSNAQSIEKAGEAYPFATSVDADALKGLDHGLQVPPEVVEAFKKYGQSVTNPTASGDAEVGEPSERVQTPEFTNTGLPIGASVSQSHLDQLMSGFSIDLPIQYGLADNPKVAPTTSPLGFDVYRYRKDFPILSRKVHGKPLVWLDNGATTQKPQVVIDAISDYYENYNSNIHRGAHELAREATDAFEDAREKVRKFIGAKSKDEIIFVRGTTEGINLVSSIFAKAYIKEGDEIIISELEHHANIVPWQFAAKTYGAKLVIARTDPNGDVILDEYRQLFNSRTRIVAFSQASNSIGTITPAEEMIKIAHENDVPVVLDGAQSVQHMPVNVAELDVDFFVFSGHKIFAPMGVGVVYGKAEWLEKLPPWQGGGAMIKDVTFEHTEFSPVPTKFEAGTPNVEGPIGLGAALDYLNQIGMPNIETYEHQITEYALRKLKNVPRLKLIGNPKHRISVLSFVMEGIDNNLIGKELDKEGIAVRVGHHCSQPILRRLGYEAVVRPSLAFYNTREEVDFLVEKIREIERKF